GVLTDANVQVLKNGETLDIEALRKAAASSLNEAGDGKPSDAGKVAEDRPPTGSQRSAKGTAARPAPWHGSPTADGEPGRTDITPAERSLLLRLQRLALRYFVETQQPGGLVLDRQRNHGPRAASGLCSTAATGMGLIALGLAAAPPYRLLPRGEAVRRARVTIEAALERLPDDRGVMPHFVHSATGAVHGADPF